MTENYGFSKASTVVEPNFVPLDKIKYHRPLERTTEFCLVKMSEFDLAFKPREQPGSLFINLRKS